LTAKDRITVWGQQKELGKRQGIDGACFSEIYQAAGVDQGLETLMHQESGRLPGFLYRSYCRDRWLNDAI
jgi:hypothetical protein